MKVYVITKESWDGGEQTITETIKVVSSPKKAEEVKRKLKKDLKASRKEFLIKYPKGLDEDVSKMTEKGHKQYWDAYTKGGLDFEKVSFYIEEFELE